MINKPSFYFVTKTIALSTCLILYSESVDITMMVISTLSFACIFLIELLITNKWSKLTQLTIIITIIACFILGINQYFPFTLVLLVHFIDTIFDKKILFYQILAVTVLLSFFLFTPNKLYTVISFTLLAFLLFSREILTKLMHYKGMVEDQKLNIVELNKKIMDTKGFMKTIKNTVSLEERNRIAARIHDQIGHGMSGSIILLEAASLVMKDNPEKANESIQKAITNLREGVDEIRIALKEERTGHSLLGKNDIMMMLQEFKVSYNIDTRLNTSGELAYIPIEIWTCIHDNLKECLTNVLKHSNASELKLNIEVFKKIIKVEYIDNGRSTKEFDKGMGLDAIEERTISCKGKCFIKQSETGFRVTNIFYY